MHRASILWKPLLLLQKTLLNVEGLGRQVRLHQLCRLVEDFPYIDPGADLGAAGNHGDGKQVFVAGAGAQGSHDEVERLSTLINNLLAINQYELGGVVAQRKNVRVSAVWRAANIAR